MHPANEKWPGHVTMAPPCRKQPSAGRICRVADVMSRGVTQGMAGRVMKGKELLAATSSILSDSRHGSSRPASSVSRLHIANILCDTDLDPRVPHRRNSYLSGRTAEVVEAAELSLCWALLPTPPRQWGLCPCRRAYFQAHHPLYSKIFSSAHLPSSAVNQ